MKKVTKAAERPTAPPSCLTDGAKRPFRLAEPDYDDFPKELEGANDSFLLAAWWVSSHVRKTLKQPYIRRQMAQGHFPHFCPFKLRCKYFPTKDLLAEHLRKKPEHNVDVDHVLREGRKKYEEAKRAREGGGGGSGSDATKHHHSHHHHAPATAELLSCECLRLPITNTNC